MFNVIANSLFVASRADAFKTATGVKSEPVRFFTRASRGNSRVENIRLQAENGPDRYLSA